MQEAKNNELQGNPSLQSAAGVCNILSPAERETMTIMRADLEGDTSTRYVTLNDNWIQCQHSEYGTRKNMLQQVAGRCYLWKCNGFK